MTKHNKLTMGFCFGGLILAIGCGFYFGFTGTLTPPMPFVIELFIIPLGLVWLSIDTLIVSLRRTQTWKDIMGHGAGLILNACFVVYLVYPAFFG
jgi:hypothetical protein